MVPVNGLLSLRSSELAAGLLGSNRLLMVGGSNGAIADYGASEIPEVLQMMVPTEGFEPPTHALRIRKSRIPR